MAFFSYFFILKDFIYFLGEGREKEREKNINVWLLLVCHPLTGDLTRNPGMCPDWELNQRPFGLQAGSQSPEPHQPGLLHDSFKRHKVNALSYCMHTKIPGILFLATWSSQEIKSTVLKRTVQEHLVCSRCAVTSSVWFQNLSINPQGHPVPVRQLLSIPPSLQRRATSNLHPPLWIYVFSYFI